MVENEVERVPTAEAPATTSPALGEEDDSIDLAEVFHRLRRGKRTILKIAFAVFAIATAIAFLLPFRYTSTTSFIPPANISSGNSMASLVEGQLSSLGAGDILGGVKNPGDLYSGILKSRSIADELIHEFHLMDVYRVKKESQAENILTASTDVSVDTKSSIVTVYVTSKSPQLAHDLASGYMDAL